MINESKVVKIDNKDRRIISFLKEDPKMSHQKIANELGLARQTIQKRIKDLEENGVIKYSVLTNDKILGKEITAFVLIELTKTQEISMGIHQEILSRMDELELLEVHYLAGQEDMLLKMRTRTIDTLRVNLVKITQMEGVSRTRTMISLTAAEHAFPHTWQEFLNALEIFE
ncbi:MAG: Lrp/AsnC family transcriptional regulator [Candidatus Hodarchaeales archaeon]|jgi:DNA-binding Lrp family transcriptional regulator